MKRFDEFVRETQPMRERIMLDVEQSVKENGGGLTDPALVLKAGLAVMRGELELYHNWVMEQGDRA